MKARIIVADAVSVHPDGTFSLLRGGIDRVWAGARGRPIVFNAGIAVQFSAGPGELGRHEFKIACVNEDGNAVAPEVSGNFEIKEPGGVVIGFNMNIVFPKPGRYSFTVSADRNELDYQTITAMEEPPQAIKPH